MPWTIFVIVGASLSLILWQVSILKYSKKIKFLLFVLLSMGIFYLPIGIIFQIGLTLPHWAVLLFGLITATSIIFISIGVFRFFISIFSILLLFTKNGKQIAKSMFLSAKVSSFSLYISIALGVFSLYEAAKVPEVKYYEFAYKNLPKELDGYKIAHISDTHSGVLFRKDWHEKLVQKVQKENTNLIVHTGDIADGSPNEVKDSIRPLLDLNAKDGVFYVMGNHENYHDITQWRDYYKKHNLKVLEDSYENHKSLPLSIVGAAAGRRTAPTDYEKLLKDIPRENFILLLDHYPNRANKSKDFVNLQLSGHTHGGTTFYLAPIVAKFNGGFVNGLYELNEDMKLFVTSCAGLWSYAPLRLFVPSEIAVIKLVKENVHN